MKDIVAIVGILMLGAGCWLAWPPLGLIVPGAIILIAAIMGHVLGGHDDS